MTDKNSNNPPQTWRQPPHGRGRYCISWAPSGWQQIAIAPTGTGLLTLGCSGAFRAIRVGIANAGTVPFTIAKVAVCPSTSWNDYVNPTGGGSWRNLTFAGQGEPSDTIVADRSVPTEITAWPAVAEALPGSGNAPRWTWTDWTPVSSVDPDSATGMHVVMFRWLNSQHGQPFTYANGLFQHGWTGLADVHGGFDYAIGGINNGSDYVTDPNQGNLTWNACRVNSPLNGTPIAIVQFLTKSPGIVGMVAGDSHHDGTGTTHAYNNFLKQLTITLGQKYRGKIPFGYVNAALGGSATREIFSRLDSLLPVVRPSFVVLPGWTYNETQDGLHANAAANEVFLTALKDSARKCLQGGAEPIFLTPFPRNHDSMTPEILGEWLHMRETIVQLGDNGALVVDGGGDLTYSECGRPTGTYLPGLSDDGVHPNDAGHAAVAEKLAQVVETMASLPNIQNAPQCSVIATEPTSYCPTAVRSEKFMKTLLFCTSYAEREATWADRWGRWLKAALHSGLNSHKILIVDDGSPYVPNWPDVAVVPAELSATSSSKVEIRHFADRRGRDVAGEPFPGWYRSFSHAVLYAIAEGFDKIIHIEADAFLISEKAIEYFNACDHGWVGLWSASHNWPESAMQIINRDQFSSCEAFFSQPYSAHLGPPYLPIERIIPFTFINKTLVGGRYGESSHTIPYDADYASQVHWGKGADYYWWMGDDGVRKPQNLWRPATEVVSQERGKRSMPRVIALSMVKNEQDIIEPFVRHTNLYVDYHVILDNRSVDDTRLILTQLMRELDGVVVTTISDFGYSQSERMTRLLRTCQAAFFADYIIFLDADEFISCPNRSELEKALAHIPSGGYGLLPWRTWVLTPFDKQRADPDPPRSMPWRLSQERGRGECGFTIRREIHF